MKVEKIYSRKKIRIEDKKVNKLKLFTFLCICIFILSIVSFLKMSYPTLKSNCETAAGAKANRIAHTVANDVMQKYKYSEFVNINVDENGEVKYAEINTVELNKVALEIINEIQDELDNAPTTTIYINYGSISGITLLKNIGPKFDIELETAGNVTYNIKSEFEEARDKSDYT